MRDDAGEATTSTDRYALEMTHEGIYVVDTLVDSHGARFEPDEMAQALDLLAALNRIGTEDDWHPEELDPFEDAVPEAAAPEPVTPCEFLQDVLPALALQQRRESHEALLAEAVELRERVLKLLGEDYEILTRINVAIERLKDVLSR